MADLISKHQSQFNRNRRRGAPLSEEPTQLDSQEHGRRQFSSDSQQDLNSLERVVVLVALILLAIAAVNLGIAVYHSQHPQRQESGQ